MTINWIRLGLAAFVIGCIVLIMNGDKVRSKKEREQIEPAEAQKTYGPEQLRTMVESNHYPEQGPIAKQETVDMSWSDCLAHAEKMIGAVAPTYPVVKIADTKIMMSWKVWVNDAAMTVTCYGDGRLHITSAPYR